MEQKELKIQSLQQTINTLSAQNSENAAAYLVTLEQVNGITAENNQLKTEKANLLKEIISIRNSRGEYNPDTSLPQQSQDTIPIHRQLEEIKMLIKEQNPNNGTQLNTNAFSNTTAPKTSRNEYNYVRRKKSLRKIIFSEVKVVKSR